MKKIIFIGGSGFIGRSYLDAYNRGVLKEFKIKKIYVISRNPGKLKKHKSLIGKNIKLIKGDISKIKKIPSSDVVIYGAENVSPKKYKNKKKVKYAGYLIPHPLDNKLIIRLQTIDSNEKDIFISCINIISSNFFYRYAKYFKRNGYRYTFRKYNWIRKFNW